MATNGYDGGDGEPQIIAALSELFARVEDDVVRNIKEKYWKIGHAIETAIERKYVEAMGLKGWMYINFRKGETTARECRQCWRDRDLFDRAFEWWKRGNTEFTPSKLTGPRFSNELCNAFRNRMLSDAEKLARRNRTKNLSAKQLKELLAMHRVWLDRLAGEHVRWAEEDSREPRVLNQIVQERATVEQQMTGDAVPLNATRPVAPGPDEDNSDEAEEEPHRGVVPNAEQETIGTGFTVVGDITPPERTPRPTKPVLQLVEPVETPTPLVDGEEVLRSLSAQEGYLKALLPVDEHGAPTPYILAINLDAPIVAEIEARWNMKGWSGPTPKTDGAARSKRASFLQHHPDTSVRDAKLLRTESRKWWLGMTTDLQVIAELKGK